jgi:hypothetical protein
VAERLPRCEGDDSIACLSTRQEGTGWRIALASSLTFAIALGVACAPAPRQRPIKTGTVDTSAASLEATRRQLEGTWELTQLETYPAAGQKVMHKATAVLTYDAYGNLTIMGRIEDSGATAGAGAPLLSFKGRAVIDADKHQLRLMNTQGPETALPAEVSPALLRQFEFEGDVLKLSTVDASGSPTATATWKKRAR